MFGCRQTLSRSKKSGNPRQCFCVVISGIETPGGCQVFLGKDIGRIDAWQPPSIFTH